MPNTERFMPRNQFDIPAPGGTANFKEILDPRPQREITAESLFNDNRLGDVSHEMMIEWDITRFDGEHIVTIGCGDSRKRIPLRVERRIRAENVQTIATGGPKHPYESLFLSRNNQAAVNLTHHDGETVEPEVMPEGCGGLGAKASIEKNGGNGHGIEKFIQEDVDHKDTIVQSTRSALKIFELSRKPVLAATQDHITGMIHPIFAVWDSRNTRHQVTNRLLTLDQLAAKDEYDPKRIYQEGLPCVDVEDLPDVFQKYIQANREEVEKLHESYPDYRRRVKTQNPETIFLTTDIRPIHAKFPHSFDAPGSFFRLTIPRKKYNLEEDLMVDIDPQEQERVFNQTEYPITHFTNMKNIIIETPSLNLSVSTAKSLLEKDWMQEWKQKEGAQVIALESQGGRVIQLAESTFNI